jgi:hypothetical protein
MTRIAPPPMKAMSPRRAYLLVVGGDPSPFVGSEMLYPPQNCIPPKADYRAEVTLPIACKLVVTSLQIECVMDDLLQVIT